MRLRFAAASAALACSMLLRTAAFAEGGGGIAINASNLSLGPGHLAGVIQLTNNRDRSDLIQVRTYAWPRSDATENLVPTSDIIGLPPVFTVAPGSFQAIRIGLRGGSSAAAERAYRVVVEELPMNDARGTSRIGVPVLMRLNFPVYVEPAEPRRAVAYSLKRSDAAHATLTASNVGNVHIKVKQIRLLTDAGSIVFAGTVPAATLFPGDARDWPVATTADAAAVTTVETTTDDGVVRTRIR